MRDSVGVENLTPHAGDKLRDIGRPWQSMYDTVRMIHRLDAWGVTAYITYMLGHPGETVAEERVGVTRLRDAVAHSQLSLRLPLEGSNDFATALSRGWIHNFEPREWRYASLVSAPDGQAMDPGEWRRFYYEAHRTVNAFDRPGGNRDRLKIKAARKEAGKIYVKGLDEAQREWTERSQAEQKAKFDAWLPDDGTSQRDRYLVFRDKELGSTHRSLESVLLPGRPDAQGNPIDIHVEIHAKKNVAPKGIVFVLTGYGETLAMSDPVIKSLVDAGYLVVAADQRGHGFSGKPLGVDGYMDSALNMFLDCQRVLEFIEDDPRLNGLPRFGFGFSQGALLHTLLDQYNPGFFSGLTLVSPTHNLGHRFDGVTAAKLAATGQTLGDFATLDFSTLSKANREGNLVPQDFTRFGSSSERQNAQKWLDRGMVPSHFLVRDSSVVWDRLIHLSLTLAAGNRQGQAPALVYVGTKDGNIAGEQALDNSRKMLKQVEARSFAGKDHQLLLEGDGLPQQILSEAVSFFDEQLPEQKNIALAEATYVAGETAGSRSRPVAISTIRTTDHLTPSPLPSPPSTTLGTGTGGEGSKSSTTGGGAGDAEASARPTVVGRQPPVGADQRVRPVMIRGGEIIAGGALFDGNAALELDAAVIAEPSVVVNPLRLVDRRPSTVSYHQQPTPMWSCPTTIFHQPVILLTRLALPVLVSTAPPLSDSWPSTKKL